MCFSKRFIMNLPKKIRHKRNSAETDTTRSFGLVEMAKYGREIEKGNGCILVVNDIFQQIRMENGIKNSRSTTNQFSKSN